MVDHQTSPGLYQNETGLFSHKPLLGFSHLVLFDGQREARREIGPSTISARLRLAVSCWTACVFETQMQTWWPPIVDPLLKSQGIHWCFILLTFWLLLWHVGKPLISIFEHFAVRLAYWTTGARPGREAWLTCHQLAQRCDIPIYCFAVVWLSWQPTFRSHKSFFFSVAVFFYSLLSLDTFAFAWFRTGHLRPRLNFFFLFYLFFL